MHRGRDGKAVRSAGLFRVWGWVPSGSEKGLTAGNGSRVRMAVSYWSVTRSRFSTSANMPTDVMTSKFGNITLRTSTPRRDMAEDDEDVAILSSFLPEYLMSPAAISKNKAFVCSLMRQCRLGDPKATPPGSLGRTAKKDCATEDSAHFRPSLNGDRNSLNWSEK